MKHQLFKTLFFMATVFVLPNAYAVCEQEVEDWIATYNKVQRLLNNKHQLGAEARQAQQDEIRNYQCPEPSGVAYAKHLLQLTINGGQSGVAEAEKQWLARRENFYLEFWNAAKSGQRKNVCIAKAKQDKCSLGDSLEQKPVPQNSGSQSVAPDPSTLAGVDSNSVLQKAADTQKKIDEARRKEPKPHRPEGMASECVALNKDRSLYGGFINSCPFSVNYYFCAFHPEKDSWAGFFNCEQNKLGLWSMRANARAAAHTRNTEMVYWFACKDGFDPADVEFVSGQGLLGRCVR